MRRRFIELELVLYLLVQVVFLAGIYVLKLGAEIWFQTTQDPTHIIFTILALFVVCSGWVIVEMFKLINQHHAVSQIVARAANFGALELTPQEQDSLFGRVIMGIKTAQQQNPLHNIDYQAEISEVVAAVDSRHNYIRFVAKVSQYLGVIGTMLGLIIVLGILHRDLSVETTDMQAQIVQAITNSMGGMYAAYATSVAGMVLGSIVLTLGTILLRSSLEKFAFRLAVICRRIIAPQLALAGRMPDSAEAKTYEVLVRGLQGVLEQFRALNAAQQAHAEAIKANSDKIDQLLKQQAVGQQQIGVALPMLERIAIAASRLIGLPIEPPKAPTSAKNATRTPTPERPK